MSKSIKKPVSKINNSNKQLTIGLLIDDSLDYPDGVQQYVLTLGRWLSRKGHVVHYLTSTTHRTDLDNLHQFARNHQVSFNGNRLRTPFPANRKRIASTLDSLNFDVLHVQAPYSPFFAGRALCGIGTHTARVATFHIAPFSKLVFTANKLLGVLSSKSRRQIDSTCAVSEPAKHAAESSGYEVTAVIPNGIDTQSFRQAGMVQHAGSPDLVSIKFLGRLVERKGCLELLRAVNQLKAEDIKQISVHIGGRGPEDGKLKEFVSRNNLESVVTFDGFIDEADKPSYLASADIVVLPSISGESFGISVVEAMATGQSVVIAGDNPGYRGVLHGRDQQLVNPRDTDALAKMIKRYLDPTERQLAIDWQNSIVDSYDIEVVGTRLLELYRSAINLRRHS